MLIGNKYDLAHAERDVDVATAKQVCTVCKNVCNGGIGSIKYTL